MKDQFNTASGAWSPEQSPSAARGDGKPDIATKAEQELLEKWRAVPAPALRLEMDAPEFHHITQIIEQAREERIAHIRDRRDQAHRSLRRGFEQSF